MHRSETLELTRCPDCGAEIDAARDRAYGLGPGRFLCYACAERRGGSYDSERDRWEGEVDASGLDLEPGDR